MKIVKVKVTDKIMVEYNIDDDKYRVTSTELPRASLHDARAALGNIFKGEIPGMAAEVQQVQFIYNENIIDTVKVKAIIDTIYGPAELALPEIMVEAGTKLAKVVDELVQECVKYCSGKRAQLGFEDIESEG